MAFYFVKNKKPSTIQLPMTPIASTNVAYLCNENKQLGERTKNTAPSIDEGMNLVFLLLFCLILFL
ncbi:hypothetical protein GDZ32_09470 [Lactobacillus helveticus]|uniref:Uncharacterized protein n=1 Tax=Lactobacillus helveticus TaxID=1587 RepID=A0A6A7K3G0_LACHE|nr:hypothetical protein [Lactobacillus helveticus]